MCSLVHFYNFKEWFLDLQNKELTSIYWFNHATSFEDSQKKRVSYVAKFTGFGKTLCHWAAGNTKTSNTNIFLWSLLKFNTI